MKILYAVDGASPSAAAGRLLAKIANPETVEVAVVSVPPETSEEGPGSRDVRRSIDEATWELVERAAASLEDAGLSVSRHVSHGLPGEEIVGMVRRDWYDLTVLGAGNKSWLDNRLLGSTSTFVLHTSPSSVMIVHDDPSGEEPAPVLLGADGSRGAALAGQTLTSLAKPGAVRVTALSVTLDPGPPVDLWPVPTGEAAAVEAAGSGKRKRLAEAEAIAAAAAETVARAGIPADHKAAVGNPTIEILKEAEDGAYDLVVLGSRGLGALRRVLLGSVSDQVARHARATLVARLIV